MEKNPLGDPFGSARRKDLPLDEHDIEDDDPPFLAHIPPRPKKPPNIDVNKFKKDYPFPLPELEPLPSTVKPTPSPPRDRKPRSESRPRPKKVMEDLSAMDNDQLVDHNSQRAERLTAKLIGQYEKQLSDPKFLSNPKNRASINLMQTFIQKTTRQYRATAAKAPAAKKPIMIVVEADDELDPKSYETIAT